MLRTNGSNTTNHSNNNHINNGWPAKNGEAKSPTTISSSAPMKSLREEYFSNGNQNNNNNNNNSQHQNNNNLNGWPSATVQSPVKTNGNGILSAATGTNSPENGHFYHGNGGSNGHYPSTTTPYTDDPSPMVNGSNGPEAATTQPENEPAEEDQLIVHNHHLNNNNKSHSNQGNNKINGNGVHSPSTNGNHHLQGNLRLMNGKLGNGGLAGNGSVKANGNGGVPVSSDRECEESAPLTGLGDKTKDAMIDDEEGEEDEEDEHNEQTKIRKELAATAPGADGQDDDDDRICGIGSCRPKWATKLASTKVFMVVFLLAWVLQGMYSTYFVSVITTIEKLFQIQSKVTGVLLSVTEIGQISTALFLTYYAGRGHRPRWIACGEYSSFDGFSNNIRLLPI